MRLWSLHPKHLDTKRLVALWRETLLAKAVLEGKTKGYTKHPQLERWRSLENPLVAINVYLSEIYNEAVRRGYKFDKSKFKLEMHKIQKLPLTQGQFEYEIHHLQNKVGIKEDKYFYNDLFYLVPGNVESWEKVKETM